MLECSRVSSVDSSAARLWIVIYEDGSSVDGVCPRLPDSINDLCASPSLTTGLVACLSLSPLFLCVCLLTDRLTASVNSKFKSRRIMCGHSDKAHRGLLTSLVCVYVPQALTCLCDCYRFERMIGTRMC